MRLAVVLPSRGLIHSRTVAAIHREAPGTPWFMAHGRPIPECFNEPVAEALAWGASHVWIVEEDMYLPVGILAELAAALPASHGVAAADYPVTEAGTLCVARDHAGTVRHAGTGCMLATAEILAAYPFTADCQYLIRPDGQWVRQPVPEGERDRVYGMHDVDFGMRLYTDGRPVHVIPTRCGQYRIARPARQGTNTDGWHEVTTWL